MNLLLDWTQLSKDFLSYGIYEWNLWKPKSKEKKDWKKEKAQNIHWLWDNEITYSQREYWKKKGKKWQKKYLKNNDWEFPKLMLDTKLQIQIREHQTEYDGKLHHGILFSVTEKKNKEKNT